MKRKNSGCCFIFLCLIFLIPGLIIFRDRLPDAETLQSLFSGVQERVEELFQNASEAVDKLTSDSGEETEEAPQETVTDQTAELLTAGQEENGCAYYYWTLDETGRGEYMKLLNGLRNMEEAIDLDLDGDSMKQMVNMVFADHPELFWAEQSYDYTLYDSRVQIRPRYTCSAEEKAVREQQVEQTVQEGLSWIPENASVYETVKALYSYVVRTVEYDLSSTDNQNIYSSMVNRVSVCTGYAKELQYLMQRAGIQALLAEGEVTGQALHAWVIGNIGGAWYHLDPTYGDPSYQETSEENMVSIPEALQVDYSYLCVDDSAILNGRTISDDLEVPVCSSQDLLYYPLHGLLFQSYSEEVLISLQDSIDQGTGYWEGQFASESAYREMVANMQEGVYANLILASHPELGSVRLHMSTRDDTYVVKMWY